MNRNDALDDRETRLRETFVWSRSMCWALLILPVLIFPLMVSAAVHSWQNNNNDLISWADDKLPVMQDFQNFSDHFGRPELVVVSWPNCSPDSPRLQSLADLLTRQDNLIWFENVVTSRLLIEELRQSPGRLSTTQLRRDLRGILLSDDGQQACLALELAAEGRANRPAAIEKLKQLVITLGIPNEDIKIGGIGAELSWIDLDSVRGPARLLPITGLVSVVLCVIMLKSLRLGLFVSTLGGFAGILSAALIHWCGVPSNAVIATLPTLGGLLTISLSLHFLGYYRNAVQETSSSTAALSQAFRWALKPTIISAVTTALGLSSLLLSRTLTIRQFGAFGALITICAAVIAITVLPAFIRLAGTGWEVRDLDRRSRWLAWSTWIRLRARPMIIVIAIVSAVFAFGLSRLKTGVQVCNLFPPQHEIIRSDQWLENNIGPMASIELVVGLEKSDNADNDLVQGLLLIQGISQHLRGSGEFTSIVSAASGMPDLQKLKGLRGVAARARLKSWVKKNRSQLNQSSLFAETETERLWRVSVRIPAMDNASTSDRCSRLQSQVDQSLALDHEAKADSAANSAAVHYYVTGLPLLFEQIETQFIEDLLVTYLGGLALITIAVFIVLRNLADAVTAMIPNVLPAIMVLGGLSILGIELDVGSVMTASIALGVAVDDTLHFVLWYQQKRVDGLSSQDSVVSAIQHCGSPILQTSIICGAGMIVLAFAPFLPTIRFGSLIAMMLGVALIGDLILLPAMLSLRGK